MKQTLTYVMTSSTVIEETFRRCAKNPAHACAYFLFDNRSAQTDQALHGQLIRSLIRQLCAQSSGVPASLVELHGSGHQQVSLASLQTVLQQIIAEFKRAYIIIDALDECTDWNKVLVWISNLLQWTEGKPRVLFSSRPEQEILEKLALVEFESLTRVSLNGKHSDADIETYVDAMLTHMTRWDCATLALVRKALITGASGMYVLVSSLLG